MRTISRLGVALSVLALVVTGCSADKPEAPTAPPAQPVTPGPPTPGAALSMSVSAGELMIGQDPAQWATIVVSGQRTDNWTALPDGTPVTVTTSLGSLGSLGGPTTLSLSLQGGRAETVIFPGSAPGLADLRASKAVSGGIGAAEARAQIRFVQEGPGPAFFIQSLSPNFGSPQGGERVDILGGGFDTPLRVIFGSAAATVMSSSSSRITVLTPRLEEAAPGSPPLAAGDTRPVNVSVTINYNEPGEEPRTDNLPQGFTYTNNGGLLQPVILSLTPASGPNEGGTEIVITGDGFESPIKVEFGEITGSNWIEAQIMSVTRNRLVVRSPAASGFGQFMLNQLVDIKVTNLKTGLFATFANGFKYGVKVLITSVGPTQGLYTGGTLVTIYGQGFEDPVAAGFQGCGGGASGAFAMPVVSVSGSEVVIRTVAILVTSCANVTCSQTYVTNINTGDGGTGPGFVFIVPKPTLFSITPTSGPQGGGTSVTISGSNFVAGQTAVFFKKGANSYAAAVQGVSSCDASGLCSVVAAITPSVPSTDFTELDCDDNGDGTKGKKYQPTAFDVAVEVGPCKDAKLLSAFTYQPSDVTCRGDLAGPPVANFTFFAVTNPAHTMQFTDTSTNKPTSWAWDFTNDGSTDSTVQNPLFTFAATGTYSTKLRACNASGCAETVKPVAVP